MSLVYYSVMESDFLESIVNQLIDEETLGVCFELHRAIKLGYYDLLHPDKRYALCVRDKTGLIVIIIFVSFSPPPFHCSTLERHGEWISRFVYFSILPLH